MDTPGEAANQRTLSVLEEIYRTETVAENSPARRRPRVGGGLDWDRLAAPLAIAVALVALTVGAAQMRSNIHFPTAGLKAIPPLGLRDLQPRFDLSLPAAGITDTDGDGLSDADETATYGSSPYLEDTDSDGTSDGDEVKAKTDPACPAGQACGVGASPTGNPVSSASPAPPGTPGGSLPVAPGLPPDVGAAAGGSAAAFDSVKIRAQLLGAGVSPELLSGFSDGQLAAVFQEAVKEQASGGGIGVGASGPADARPLPALPTMTELRSLLVQQGLPQATADQLTDQQLEQLVQEVLGGLPPQP